MTGDSGCEKRKKKKGSRIFIKSQKGSMDRFVIKKNVNENPEPATKDNSIESKDHFDDSISH